MRNKKGRKDLIEGQGLESNYQMYCILRRRCWEKFITSTAPLDRIRLDVLAQPRGPSHYLGSVIDLATL